METINFIPSLVPIVGSVNAVLLLCYLKKIGAESGDGVCVSGSEILSGTGLTYREQSKARGALRELGILTETHRRLIHKVYYHIDGSIFSKTGCFSRNDKTSIRETTKSDMVTKSITDVVDQTSIRETTKSDMVTDIVTDVVDKTSIREMTKSNNQTSIRGETGYCSGTQVVDQTSIREMTKGEFVFNNINTLNSISSLALKGSSLKEKEKEKEKIKKEKEKENSVFALPLHSGKEFFISQVFYSGLVKTYPGVSAMGELEKMRMWLLANPNRMKTDRGMPRFVNAWMSRASSNRPNRAQERQDEIRRVAVEAAREMDLDGIIENSGSLGGYGDERKGYLDDTGTILLLKRAT